MSKSLRNEGISRFGWSYYDSANLKDLEQQSWESMNEKEIETWNKSKFLLGIKQGDWVVHINVPYWGACSAAKIDSGYFFEETNNEIGDFRHCLKIDKNSLIEFERNAEEIHPYISARLKLQGKYWRIFAEKEFLESLNNLKNGTKITNKGDSIGLHFLKDEIKEVFQTLTHKIHKTHPEKKLEYLICELFKNVPNVVETYVNGSGWGTDFGADVVVKYTSGLGILNLQHEETLVIQVKSYEGKHWNTNLVNQIKTAMEKFKAHCGLIITTAKSTKVLEEAVDNLSKEIDKPVALLAGNNVAKFFLKFEKGMLFEL